MLFRSKFVKLEEVTGYDEVCITGGEPMLNVGVTEMIIDKVRQQNPNAKVFMYTALFHPYGTRQLIDKLDGIQFSVHAEATLDDMWGFQQFQDLIHAYPQKTFRAYIDPRIKFSIKIEPHVWFRFEIKRWIEEGACPVPSHETLLILEEE